MKNIYTKICGSILYLALFTIISTFTPTSLIASTTDGTIDSSDRYAWGANVGWIDFGTTAGEVHVTDTALTGYAYGENIGWISLDASDTDPVTNDAEGNLSGYAWGANVGWIDFDGVVINSSGVFTGYAYGENIGWINFTTDNPVTTDWRPASSRGGGDSEQEESNEETSSRKSSSSASSRVRNLIAQGNLTLAQQVAQQYNIVMPGTTPSGTPTVTPTTFPRNLTVTYTGPDVKLLQQYLNSKGFTLALSGPGSPGNETTIFGPLTRSALARFQSANNISPAVGFFGPITRAFIQANP